MLASEWVPTVGIVIAAGLASSGGVLAFFTARRAADLQRRDSQLVLLEKKEARIDALMHDRVLLVNYAQELRADILDRKDGPPRAWPDKIFD